MAKLIKIILALLLCFQGISFPIIAQQQASGIPELMHLQNPEVKKVIQLSSEGNFSKIETTYRNLNELNSDDALDLLVFAASRYKIQDVIDWQWIANEYTLTLMHNYTNEHVSSDEELYRKGIINYVMGILLGNKNILSNSYIQLHPLAQKGWEETIMPITEILYEMYINQYHPVTPEEIVPTIIEGVRSPTAIDNVIQHLASGLEDPYASIAGTEEKLLQERKLVFTKAFLEQVVAGESENSLYIFYSLMEKSAVQPGLSDKIQYREEYTKQLDSIINGLISKYPTESLSLKQLYLVRKMIYDSPAESSQLAQTIVSLHQSKEEAFDLITQFLYGIPTNASYETLARSDRKWTDVFENELLTWDTENLPLILRYTDLYIPYLTTKKVNVSELLESLTFQEYVVQSLTDDVNEIAFNPKFLPEIVYDMYARINQIRSLKMYQEAPELKYLEALYLMHFHEYYTRLNKIHSPRILTFNNTFDDWTSAEIKNFPRQRAINFVNSYTKTLSESGLFLGSLEHDFVLSEIDKFIKKFDLK